MTPERLAEIRAYVAAYVACEGECDGCAHEARCILNDHDSIADLVDLLAEVDRLTSREHR